MRSFVIAAVMTALVAGLGFVIAPSPRDAAAPTSMGHEATAPLGVADADGADPTIPSSASPSADEAPAAKPGKSIFYQWTDERGSVRFARSLDEVPAQWRERAGQIEVDASAFQPAAPGPAKTRPAPRAHADASDAPAKARFADVTVYTAPWCGWCRKTLAWLDERDIDYTNKDIDADDDYAQELVAKSGGRSIPFVEIDGTQIRGYNPHQMAALLE